jgi:hypothetical protein
MEAKTPQELNTQESISPDEKQQNRIGTDANERSISWTRRRCSFPRFSSEAVRCPFTLIFNFLIG